MHSVKVTTFRSVWFRGCGRIANALEHPNPETNRINYRCPQANTTSTLWFAVGSSTNVNEGDEAKGSCSNAFMFSHGSTEIKKGEIFFGK